MNLKPLLKRINRKFEKGEFLFSTFRESEVLDVLFVLLARGGIVYAVSLTLGSGKTGF